MTVPARSGRWISVQRAAATAYAVGMFMSIMDTQIVNVALPTLRADFDASNSAVQWVVIGYLLGLAICIPASGWLGDQFGTKRIYLLAMVVFGGASLACAASTNLPELVITRTVQGIGGGMMLPLGMATLYRAVEPGRRVHLARSITRVTMIAPATAPIIGGLLVDRMSWHWIFLVNVPVAVAMVVFGAFYLPSYSYPRGRFDIAGLITGSAGLASVLYALSMGPIHGWTSPDVLSCAVVGVGALSTFSWLGRRSADAVLRLSLLADRTFRRCCGLISLQQVVFFGTLLFTALFVQEGRGASPIQSGLTTFPEALGIAASSQFASRLYPRIGPRRLITAGFVGLAMVAAGLALIGDSGSLWPVRLLSFALGACASFVMLPNQAAAFATMSSADTGHASAIFTTVQRSSAAVGVVVLTTVLHIFGGAAVPPPTQSFHAVFACTSFAALVGAVVALGLHDADVASTMVRAPRTGRQPATASTSTRTTDAVNR